MRIKLSWMVLFVLLTALTGCNDEKEKKERKTRSAVSPTAASVIKKYQGLKEACTVKVAETYSYNAKTLTDYKAKVATAVKKKAEAEKLMTDVLGPGGGEDKAFYYGEVNVPFLRYSAGHYYVNKLKADLDSKGRCVLEIEAASDSSSRYYYKGHMSTIIYSLAYPENLKDDKGNWDYGEPLNRVNLPMSSSPGVAVDDVYFEVRNLFLKQLVKSETQMRLVGWLMDSEKMWGLLDGGRQEAMKALLPHYFKSSKVDFSQLLAEVREYDALEEQPEGCEYGLFWSCYPKLEVAGYFLRTWMRDGGEVNLQRASELMAVRQFWMVMLARKLGLEQAETWANEVVSKLQLASTLAYRDWYLSTLSAGKMPPPPKGNSLYVEPEDETEEVSGTDNSDVEFEPAGGDTEQGKTGVEESGDEQEASEDEAAETADNSAGSDDSIEVKEPAKPAEPELPKDVNWK